MKIVKLETFLANCGLRNYLFLRLTTDTGLTGIGEATLEWQEQTVRTLIHEWLEERLLGEDPRDIERVFGNLIRDQYQGGSTVMTAISGVEIACWDILGKANGQPVYELLGGRAREEFPAYANGWYGGAVTPEDYAAKAKDVVSRGYTALKFDPFGVAWQVMAPEEMDHSEQIVAAVRDAVGDEFELMIEFHGRLCVAWAVELALRLEPYHPAWYEEPVTPWSLDYLAEVKGATSVPIAAGERLYMLEEFERLAAMRACDIAQPDLAHCGGLHIGKKIAALCEARDIRLAPHCSIGPVALCAAVHFGWSTPEVLIQENFAEYDVPWRSDMVHGWTGIHQAKYLLPEKPGLGIELNEAACAKHPYQKHAFPSLWDDRWLKQFTRDKG
ncbi:MAG: mandelate racemase/muconate lactonizing enzyme family protein [Pirellulaceae bacterium]|nr:mandelate racemase/muconate lactonizing enzyme family protein [Pirellulaceae bacterium]